MSKLSKRNNDLDYLNGLSKEELKWHYYCHPIHRYGLDYTNKKERHEPESNCPYISGLIINHLSKEISDLNNDQHYCSSLQNTSRLASTVRDTHTSENCLNEPGLLVCENYPASYQSKRDQCEKLKSDIGQLRKSKLIMKNAMKDLDKLLEESKMIGQSESDVENVDDDDDDGDDVYGRYIRRSMSVKSLNKHYLPRDDFRKSKEEEEETSENEIENEEDSESCFGPAALFQTRHVNRIFLDKDLFAYKQNLVQKKTKKNEKNQPDIKLKSILIKRPKSSNHFK